LLSGSAVSQSTLGEIPANDALPFLPGMSLATVERRLLEMTLAATGGNRSRAAEMLGISLRTVRNKVREYNLPPRREYARVTY
jgi:DNA-binding NtrC family response regulator